MKKKKKSLAFTSLWEKIMLYVVFMPTGEFMASSLSFCPLATGSWCGAAGCTGRGAQLGGESEEWEPLWPLLHAGAQHHWPSEYKCLPSAHLSDICSFWHLGYVLLFGYLGRLLCTVWVFISENNFRILAVIHRVAILKVLHTLKIDIFMTQS